MIADVVAVAMGGTPGTPGDTERCRSLRHHKTGAWQRCSLDFAYGLSDSLGYFFRTGVVMLVDGSARVGVWRRQDTLCTNERLLMTSNGPLSAIIYERERQGCRS
jgi:hypothetical protein